MPQATTLATIAALALAGAGVGVQLGESAIAGINPVFFAELSQPTYYADLTPTAYRLGQAEEPQPADYWVNDANVSGRPFCLDCPDNFIEPILAASAPMPDAMGAGESTAPPPDAPRSASQRQLDRYMNFPISSDQAETAAVPQEEFAHQTEAVELEEAWQPRGM